jgi:uncharacterized protein
LRIWLLALLLGLAASFAAHAEVPVPDLSRRVTDLTGTLTPDTVSRLENTLAQFEAAKGSQIAVLMLPTTKPEDIAEYGIRVADKWKVGRKGVDDGAILIVAKDDRRVRIEVGYGLEGVIPDAVAKRIIEEDIVPRFRQGDFSGGVEAGVSRMMRLVEGEPLPPPQTRSRKGSPFPESLFLILVGGILIGKILDLFLGTGVSSLTAAAVAGGLAWFVSGIMFASIVIAFIVLIGVIGGVGGRRGLGGGHWSSGGLGGGGGWSGGGGFSGGGGGFGGGGSSGSW